MFSRKKKQPEAPRPKEMDEEVAARRAKIIERLRKIDASRPPEQRWEAYQGKWNRDSVPDQPGLPPELQEQVELMHERLADVCDFEDGMSIENLKCIQAYTKGLLAGREEGYDIGFDEGYEQGHAQGYDEGYKKGEDEGFGTGYIFGDSDAWHRSH